MRIALIGYGNVGKAFVKLLENKKYELKNNHNIDIYLTYVINSSGGIYAKDGVDISRLIAHTDRELPLNQYSQGGSSHINVNTLISNNDVDLAVEITPTNKDTGEPGMTHIKSLIKNGIHVVTGNKGPILLAFNELSLLANENDVQLAAGCTTGGALPSINGGLLDLAGAKITKIQGILNGTTNFIIEEMEKNNLSYEDALIKAQSLGIAETNPILDVGGWDTAAKILILTNILMKENKTLKDITIEGITSLTPIDIIEANKNQEKYKLIGTSYKCPITEEVKITVKLEKVPHFSPLYSVNGKNKAVSYTTDTLGDLTLIGGASDTMGAAASLLRDIVNIHKGYRFIY